MKKNIKDKKTKVEVFEKKNLYHDIKAEKQEKLGNSEYLKKLLKLEIELVKLQEWVKDNRLRVVVIFEGRDAAGKGGVIKTIAGCLNPRICRIVALGIPTEKEKSQWYFQRYVRELPSGGEITLFDRSWYNRAGVEKVMGYCTNEEYEEFLRSCPEFERMLIRSGIILIKYWFSIIKDPTKRWKISQMDIESRDKWVEYSMAKDKMFSYTDTRQSPWIVVPADDKRRARLNCIDHFLSLIPYKDLTAKTIKLPPLKHEVAYVRPPITEQNFVPEKY
jgi:polyphosphate kinase 2